MYRKYNFSQNLSFVVAFYYKDVLCDHQINCCAVVTDNKHEVLNAFYRLLYITYLYIIYIFLFFYLLTQYYYCMAK